MPMLIRAVTENARIATMVSTSISGSQSLVRTARLTSSAQPANPRSNADSGVFIRKPQLQCRDYPIAGPYKNLKNYKPQDWNEMIVVVKDGVAHCTCNGEVLEAALKVPDTGPIGLEGDRGQMEYRRIRIKEEN